MRVTTIVLLIMFAFVHSKAQIVYKDVTPDIKVSDSCAQSGCAQMYYLDLNGDGINDFEVFLSAGTVVVPCGTGRSAWITSLNSNEVTLDKLPVNTAISNQSLFDTGSYLLRKITWVRSGRNGSCNQSFSGKWVNADGYVALELIKGGQVYFGWLRLNVSVTASVASFTVKDYAYNSSPGQPILSGQKTNFNWSIVTALSSSPYCPGSPVNVAYVTGGSFKTSNVFTAQLSDTVGSFAKPVIIGSIQSSSSGTVKGVIPAKTAAGTQYRIRVVSSNSSDSSYNNGTDLVIGAGIYGTAPTEYCQGATGGLYLVAPIGYAYKWQENGKLIQGESTYSLQVDPLATEAPGTYTYRCIITGMCGTDTSNAIVVKVDSLPKPTVTASGPTTFCKGGSVTLLANKGTGLTYQWMTEAGNIPGATKSSYVAANTISHYYSVMETNTKGCVAFSDGNLSHVVVIFKEPAPVIYAAGDTTFCAGDSVILNITNLYNADSIDRFQWMKNGTNIPGAIYKIDTAKAAGIYTCKVTNACGSTITNGINVTVNQCNKSSIVRQKAIGGSLDDLFTDMYVTSDGGVIAGGTSYSDSSYEKTKNGKGNGDYWVVKMDKNGTIQWDKTIGGSDNDNFKSVIQTSDGGYALIGESKSNISYDKTENSRGSSDYWLVKLDSKGNIQWDKTIGGSGTEYIDHIVQTSDGGYILAGSSDSPISGDKSEDSLGFVDYWVVKLDKNGKKVWDKTIGGSNYDWCSPVALTSDGGVIVGGFSLSNKSGNKTEDSRGGYDYWLVKLDGNGNIQWDKTIGGNADEYCHGINQTSDGGYIIAGSSLSGISGEKTETNRGGADYWAVKIDKNRNIKWNKTIGGNGDDWCNGMIKTSSGGYMLVGGSLSSASGDKAENSRGGADYWIVNLDSSGRLLGEKTIGGTADDWGNAIAETSTNTFLIGGTSYSPVGADKTEFDRGGADYWIVTLNYQNSPNASGGPLPLTFINFNGILKNNETELTWTTANEINNKGFEAEKSTDSKNFLAIGFIKSKGNTAAETNYDFTDAAVQEGMNYYRLKQTDKDGNFIYSSIIKIAYTNGNANTITIAPNPFSNNTSISFILPQSQKVAIQIFDMNGRLIKTIANSQMQAGVHQLTWNTTNENGTAVAPGMYYLKLNAGNYVETKKMALIK